MVRVWREKWRGEGTLEAGIVWLTIGEMHARVLVGEDGFGAVAGGRAAAQRARVTSSWSSA